MKVYLNGASHWGSQNPRIADGFRTCGHEVTPYISDASLVYSNDSHAQVIADKVAGNLRPGAKVILTVLDLPLHLGPAFDYAGLKAQLAAADAVCSISQYVQWQLRHYLGVESTVIYQPTKPVQCDPAVRRRPFYRFAHVGRRSDLNKRASLGYAALQLLGYTERDLCLVGNEPGWGDYQGVLNDENLNVVYNSVDFVFTLGLVEGLSLPTLEAMACGAVPVVCCDMTTRTELLPPDLFPEYESVEPDPRSIATFLAGYLNDESGERLIDLQDRLHQHYWTTWADRCWPEAVAGEILKVHETLK